MSKSRFQKKPHLSRSIRNEFFTAKFLFIVSILLATFVTISLGSRQELSSPSKMTAAFNTMAHLIMRWEAPAKEREKTGMNDNRSHAGFHFDWPSRLNPPQFGLTSILKDGREERVSELLKIGKSDVVLEPLKNSQLSFQINDLISTQGDVKLRKSILVLLPGEQIQISYNPTTTTSPARQWKIRVRTIAVTRDRLDSPLPVLSGFSKDIRSKSEISPKGQHLDIEIPPSSEYDRRNEKIFIVEWPKDSSGILVIEGFQPSIVDSVPRSQFSRNLIIHINTMQGTLTDLKKTISTLEKETLDSAHHLHLSSVIPPSVDFLKSEQSLLTGRAPVDLGESLQNKQLRTMIEPEQSTLNKALNHAGSTRKISLETKTACRSECLQQKMLVAENIKFTSELSIERLEEYSSTSALLNKSEFLTDPGLLYVHVNAKPEDMRLNWESLELSNYSMSKWLAAGIGGLFERSDLRLKNEEHKQQLDIWIARLLESFLSDSPSSNVAIFLHNSENPIPLGANSHSEVKLLRGEALLSLQELEFSDGDDSKTAQIDASIGLLPALRFFENISFGQKVELSKQELNARLIGEPSLVSQVQQSAYITMTPDGWLQDPKFSSDHDLVKTLYHAAPEKIYLVQETSNISRRKGKLHGVHFTLPATNALDELIEAHVSTNLKGIGCDSQNENTQLKIMDVKESWANPTINFKVEGRRAPKTIWHVFCLFEGRVSNSTQLRLSFKLNQQSVPREQIGLGEFSLPVRGFLWRTPDAIELLGAQILDATVSLGIPDLTSANQSVLVWSERIPNGIKEPKSTFNLKAAVATETTAVQKPPASIDRLSEK